MSDENPDRNNAPEQNPYLQSNLLFESDPIGAGIFGDILEDDQNPANQFDYNEQTDQEKEKVEDNVNNAVQQRDILMDQDDVSLGELLPPIDPPKFDANHQKIMN